MNIPFRDYQKTSRGEHILIVEKRRGEKWSSVLHTGGDKFVRRYIQETNWFKLCQQERKAKEKVQH